MLLFSLLKKNKNNLQTPTIFLTLVTYLANFTLSLTQFCEIVAYIFCF
jgi:hypothetical protein